MKTLVLFLGGLCALLWTYSAQAQTVPVKAETLTQLSGIYADPASYEYGKGVYGRRVFSFNHGTWSLHFTLSLDPAQKVLVFEYRCVGTYTLLAPSEQVKNAWNALFYTDKKYVTLRTPDAKLAEAFGLAACDLKVGEEKDVSDVGCAGWRPVRDCREDHDLLAWDKQGRLYFGVRPRDNNMCTPDKRPTAFTPPVVKQ